jgi:hypothetical protein
MVLQEESTPAAQSVPLGVVRVLARRDRWANEPVIIPLSPLLTGWRVLLTGTTTQPPGMSGDIRLAHDTGFAPNFDVASAVADYVAWRAGNSR